MVTELPGFAKSLPAAVSELRESTEELVQFFWDEIYRANVCAQASALAQAAKIEGHGSVFKAARAIASLCFIPIHEAIPLRHEVSDKLMELVETLGESVRVSDGEQTG